MSESGRRPNFNTIKLNPQSSDPVNPVSGETFFSDGTSRPRGEYVYDGSQWNPVTLDSSNYISNPNALAAVAPFVTYADAAGSQPVDGTGGSPTITLTRDTNSLVVGATSFLITKGASNSQGQGISVDFTIDNALKNCPIQISNRLNASANFVFGSIDGVTPSDVTVYVYDVTNATLLQVFPNVLTSNIGEFIGSFQATSSTSYRLIYHIGTTNALAWTLALGQISVRPLESISISTDSDWVSWTPATAQQGFGNISGVNAKYKKNGPNADFIITFTSGTVTSSEARFELPPGLVAASTLPAKQLVGMFVTNGTSSYFTVLMAQSGTYFTFGKGAENGNGYINRAGNLVSSSGDIFTFYASVPIQGWTSGYATPAVSAQNVPVQFSAYKSAGSITANTTIASWTGTFIDSVGAWNGTTGQYTVKIPGVYNVIFSEQTSSADLEWPQIRVNGTIFSTGTGGGSTASRKIAYLKKYLNVGDVVTVDHSGNATIATNTTGTILSIEKCEDPSAFLNIPKVATLSDVKASGTAGGTFTSGSYQTRVLNTVSDPFGIVSLASNQFTLQPGTYYINGFAPVAAVELNRAKIRNVTAGTDAILGGTNQTGSTGIQQTGSYIDGIIILTVPSTFELQHRCQTTRATNGFGYATSFGENEVYSVLKIQKLL